MAKDHKVFDVDGNFIGYLDVVKGADSLLKSNMENGEYYNVIGPKGTKTAGMFGGNDNISGITVPYDWHIDLAVGGALGAAKAGVKTALSQGSKVGIEKIVESMYRGAGTEMLKKSGTIASKKAFNYLANKAINDFATGDASLLKHPGDDSITPPDNTKTRLDSPDQIKIDESVGGSIDLNYPGMGSITPPDNTGVNLGTTNIPGYNPGWDVFSPSYLPQADFPGIFPSMSIMGAHPVERFMPSGMGNFSPSGLLGSIFGSLGLGGGTPDPGWMIKDESWGKASCGRGGLGGSFSKLPLAA